MIASTDHAKGKFSEVLAVKDREIGAFVRRYSLTSLVSEVRTKRECFKNENIEVAINIKK